MSEGHDRAQSFVLRSYTIMNYVTKPFLLISSSVRSIKHYCVLCGVKVKKKNKKIQQRTLSSFITISPLSSPLEKFQVAYCVGVIIIRHLAQNTTATATGTSPNKRFDEQNTDCARAL